jgi:hypothetical protein
MINAAKGKIVTLPTRQAMKKHGAAEIKLHNILLAFSFAERGLSSLQHCRLYRTI